jgi:FlaA1/EpsC-like NDP-sugar epimerase
MEKQASETFISKQVNNMFDIVDDKSNLNSKISEVTEFFNGLNIFVTGGSGFVGKLLIEKILR